MAKRRRSRRYSGFGALPALLALPLVKYGLAAGAAYLVLKKKPAGTMASQLVNGQAPTNPLYAVSSSAYAQPGMEWAKGADIMGSREVEEEG